jgi:excisionase family DNA binding protein
MGDGPGSAGAPSPLEAWVGCHSIDVGSNHGPERLTLTVEEAARSLGVSRAHAYELAARGEIPTLRLGRRILVPREALVRMMCR